MRSKYYTPKIEEFHIGFEYEWKNPDDTDWTKESSPSEITPENYEEQAQGLRVKFFDKEDILNLNFQQISDDCYNLDVAHFRGLQNQEVRILVRESVIIYLAMNSEDKDNIVLFAGNIKNKSEFRVLLKQLNILK
jgi:hypothetical protein